MDDHPGDHAAAQERRQRSILVVSETWHPQEDPAAVHLWERACIWARAGHSVQVIHAGPDGSIDDGTQCHRVVTIPRRRRLGMFWRGCRNRSFQWGARRMAGRLAPVDVVLSTSPPLNAGAVGQALSRRLDVPHVLEVRDLWPDSIAQLSWISGGPVIGWMSWVERTLYRSASAVIAMTEPIGDACSLRGARDVQVIHGGANLDLFKPTERCVQTARRLEIPDGPIVGFLGTLGRAPGFDTLLDAAPALGAGGVSVLIMGSGVGYADIEREIRRRQLTNVHLRVALPRQDMPKVWSLLDAGLVLLRDAPVLGTVRPMKMFEGLAMGVPMVVSAPEGESTDWLERSRAGRICPPGDADALSAAVLSFLEDDELRHRCAQSAAEEGARWSRQAQADATLDVLESVITSS